MERAERQSLPVLLREDRGAVSILTLNRPEKLNALSNELKKIPASPRQRNYSPARTIRRSWSSFRTSFMAFFDGIRMLKILS
jgi:hypothetical protein